ncbi:MAG TPA: hypothetical protein VF159_13835 [Gemmatimonadaceae bacterium]
MSSDAVATPRAIVAGHGEFARGLISAVEQITGRGNELSAIEVKGLGGQDIESALRQCMVDTGARVVFTDLQAGSCTVAARRVLRGMDDAVLVVGTNLPMLLDFVFAADKPPAEAAIHAAERGRAAVAVHGATA